MRRGPLRPDRRRQGGQAMVEYFVVIAFSVILLTRPLSSTQPSVVDQLAQAIRDYHTNYTFAMAVAYVPNCTYAFSFDQIRPSQGIGAVITSGFNLTGTVDRCFDVSNPQLPMPDISATFSFQNFTTDVESVITDMISTYVSNALSQFTDPASLLSGFTGFDMSSFF